MKPERCWRPPKKQTPPLKKPPYCSTTSGTNSILNRARYPGTRRVSPQEAKRVLKPEKQPRPEKLLKRSPPVPKRSIKLPPGQRVSRGVITSSILFQTTGHSHD